MRKGLKWFANRSIFLKILLIIIFAALVVNLAVSMIFHAATAPPQGRLFQFVKGCVRFVGDSLGDPPRRDRALQMSEKLGVNIAYRSERVAWATDGSVGELGKVRFSSFHSGSDVRFGRFGEKPYIRYRTDKGDYFFSTEFVMDDRDAKMVILTMVLLLSLVFFGVYYWIRRIFRQVDLLKEGVTKVGQGDFAVSINSRNQDELGQLTNAFNQMTEKIRHSMQNQKELLWNVSHELRSPITRMRLNLEFIEDEETQGKLKKDLSAMEGMIAEILEAARLNEGKREQKIILADMGELIQGVVEEVVEDPALVELDLPSSDFHCEIEERSMVVLIKNLLENALKYSDAKAKPVTISLRESGGKCLLQVADHGEGVPKEDLPFIFEPFYRVDKSRNQRTGGYGLGLSLCREIVKAHEGRIWMESEQGVETRVKVELPMVKRLDEERL